MQQHSGGVDDGPEPGLAFTLSRRFEAPDSFSKQAICGA
jgi:hypothetical protein